MPKFYLTEIKEETHRYDYEVEADNREQAVEEIQAGLVDYLYTKCVDVETVEIVDTDR